MPTDATTIHDTVASVLEAKSYFALVEQEYVTAERIGARFPAAMVIAGSEAYREEKSSATRILPVHVFYVIKDTDLDPDGKLAEVEDLVISTLWNDYPKDGTAGYVMFARAFRKGGVYAPFGEMSAHLNLPPPFAAGRVECEINYFSYWS